uniref:Uncharacterized protein n=1 Tax=Strongyloides stercoralis TaxID=6248 RepID=A0AAF5I3A2_STRER
WSGVNVVTQAYYSKNKKILALWILFIISMNLFAVYSILKIYANKKPIIKMHTTREILKEDFPYVTICFDVAIDYNTFDSFLIGKDYIETSFDNIFRNTIKYSSFRDSKLYIRYLKFTDYSNRRPVNTNIHESCFKFDFSSEKHRSFLIIGRNFGLSLFISNEISKIDQHFQKALGYNLHLAIYYSLNNNTSFRDLHFHKNMIPLGHETNIPIVISKEIRDYNLSECYNFNKQKGNNFFGSDDYSFESCFMNCLRTKEMNECPSSTPYTPYTCSKHDCRCKSDECLNCSSNLIFPERKESKLLHPEFINSCSCKHPCNYYTFKTSPSSTKLHTKNMIKRFNLKGNYDDLKKDIEANYAIVNFFIKEKEIVTKTQVVFGSTANVFSDIGNTLSLLLGLGMINFIEIFFCIFVLCFSTVIFYVKKCI